ncbi:MAG: qor, partial [Aeromicrobium sp.]|nr:qor [Aeromicrobium sp.]
MGAGWGEYLRFDPSALAVVARGLQELVSAGLRPPVSGRFPLADGRRAVELLSAGAVLGKVVLEV